MAIPTTNVYPGGNFRSNTDTPTNKVGKLISDEQLQRLSALFPPPSSVRNDTSELQAGYLLGVQAVLNALRTGF